MALEEKSIIYCFPSHWLFFTTWLQFEIIGQILSLCHLHNNGIANITTISVLKRTWV